MQYKWMDNVRKVEPYVAGEQPKNADVIKLNTNENPYPPAPEVRSIINGMDTDILRKYPDPTISDLVNALADYHGVGHDQVFAGVGSDDVLSVAFLTFFAGDKPIIFPDITYAFYPVWADVYRIPYGTAPVGADFRINAADYMKENGGIVIANPNAPTSIWEAPAFFEEILKNNPSSMVIVDEAYVDFSNGSVLPLLEKYDNLLIVRTYSKSRSMAGMRIGYAIGRPEAIAAMNDIKQSINSYTLTQIAIASGVASVNDEKYFAGSCAKVVATRDKYDAVLRSIGFSGPKSQTNFLFFKHERVGGNEIFKRLREQNIFVRHFSKPAIDDYLRITIGTDEEMERLTQALKDIVK